MKSDNWIRAIVAGFGYALVLRSKLTDIKIGEKEVPAGFDIIYQALSSRLLLNIGWVIDEKERETLDRIYQSFPDIDIYLEELHFMIEPETDANKKNRLSSEIQKIGAFEENNRTQCKLLAKILLDRLGSEKTVRSRLNAISQSRQNQPMGG
ncbi:hypothetical protein HYR99_12850 [Candidatus Poribacteria bacterium]|nr:hypothetical protein [Candidatus Poribacteria bacterium]